MTKTLRDVSAQAETWPREDQDELAVSDDERAAVRKGLAEARSRQVRIRRGCGGS
jgi:hypothetical protein